MEADIKRLDRICSDIANVALDMMEGKIDFKYDNLMSAMKPAHPCEIMDGIFQEVYFSVVKRQEPPIEKMEKTLHELEDFNEAFQIKELTKPLEEFAEYIKDRKGING